MKGTTSDGATVVLTRNEVRHVREDFPRVALFIVAHIRLSIEDGMYRTSGGETIVYEPWMPREESGQAIPPAYTEWIGRQLLDMLGVAA